MKEEIKEEAKEKMKKSGSGDVKESVRNRKREKHLTKKKAAVSILAALMAVTLLTGCGNEAGRNSGKDEKKPITVITREDGSGTRGAFNELMGVTADGVDNTAPTAEVSQSTAVVMATVAGNPNAIGYISLGSLNDSVKAVQVNGMEASVENIMNGSYAAARPFLALSKGELSPQAEDFMRFAGSREGQEIIQKEGYITTDENAEEYEAAEKVSGKIVIAGSTSVAPLMQKLADAYKAIHSDVSIEIQQSGSGAGIIGTIEGACDIGMSSRELKPEEESEGIKANRIAVDGIVVIVNVKNQVENLTSEQLRQIFTGELTDWSEVK